ncbi:MAG: ABC transporter ATP-binding protein [Ruminococcaceae bacterium]|nr:ABC transporter ATP-binding protein [Oscillospiraceae bacterium]
MRKSNSTLSKILKYIGKYKFLMLLSALLALVIVALTLYVPILIGNSIDLIIGRGEVDFGGIIKNLTAAGIMILITAVSQWAMTYLNNKVTYQVVRDMRNDAFEKLERLPISYIDSHAKGDVVSRIISDVDHFADGLLLGFTHLFTGILTIVGTLVFMVTISWKIALVVVVLTPLSLFIAKFIGTRTHDMFTLRSKTTGEQTAHIDETVGNQKVVLAFSREDESIEAFEEINARLEKASLKAIFFSSLVNPTTRFVNNVVYAAVALTGAFTAIATAGSSVPFTVGQLSCLLSYTNQYTKPFNEISGVVTEFQNALASAARIFELIEEEDEIPDAPDASVLTNPNGEVSMKDVSFSYTPEKKLIENLNLSVKSGSRIAIVGPTGCGKTTLINLLMRFYDVCGGEISVDGTDIRKITRSSLRKNYGMVLQETWLASGTVRENIAMGRPDATDEEIISAAKASHAHGFIKRMKNGYDTVITGGGESLSQGQRQLISIARIMLALPPMLILDEATSSIDTRTEIKIQEAFSKMMVGRTSFIVAHRLSTIKNADVILVMKDGNIIEQGSHTELLSINGFYKELYESQFKTVK